MSVCIAGGGGVERGTLTNLLPGGITRIQRSVRVESGNFFYDATKAPPGDCKIQQYLCVVTLFTVIKTEKKCI